MPGTRKNRILSLGMGKINSQRVGLLVNARIDRFVPTMQTTVTRLLLAAALTSAGCGKKGDGVSGAAAPPPVQVVAIEVRSQPVVETVMLVGSVAANEMIEVKSEIDGVIETIAFEEGKRVEKGQLLVGLDESKHRTAVQEAEANFKLSQTTYDRLQQLLRDKLISQQDFDQAAAVRSMTEAGLELKKRMLKDSRIVAPFAGIVGSRQISPGQVISRNTTLTWLVDLDPVKIEVQVPERFLGQIHIGQKIHFGVAAYPNDMFEGEIYVISPQIQPETRTALVKARVPNPGQKLKGGMFAKADLTLRIKDAALLVPEPALVNNGDLVTVFSVDASGNAVVKPVTVGMRLSGKAEILSGLTVGEKIVVEGVQKLRPGGAVRFAPPEAAAPYLK